MRSIPNNAPSNVAALDTRDVTCGNASHLYAVQYGGPGDICYIQFQHGPRAVEGSVAGVFDDDLLAVLQDRLEGFQSGQYACPENATALHHVQLAREALGLRVARRLAQGVLGANQTHTTEPAADTVQKPHVDGELVAQLNEMFAQIHDIVWEFQDSFEPNYCSTDVMGCIESGSVYPEEMLKHGEQVRLVYAAVDIINSFEAAAREAGVIIDL